MIDAPVIGLGPPMGERGDADGHRAGRARGAKPVQRGAKNDEHGAKNRSIAVRIIAIMVQNRSRSRRTRRSISRGHLHAGMAI